MSSTGQATSSISNFQLIVDALADYAKLTGIDLSNSAFAQKLDLSITPQAILELLQERENAFKEFRDRNRGLISCISPAVEVLHAFSGALGEAAGVSNTYYRVNLQSESIATLFRFPSHQQRLFLSGLMLSSLYVPQHFFQPVPL
jgi:hypothetical protein